VSHKHDRAEKHKSCSFAGLPHELWRQRIVLSVICPLPTVRVLTRGFPQMGGCYLLKYNGGDSGIKISVLYWRCSLIRGSVIRGGSNMTGTNCDLFTHKSSRSYLNHLVFIYVYRSEIKLFWDTGVTEHSFVKDKRYVLFFFHSCK
jgi:hypothetical protein